MPFSQAADALFSIRDVAARGRPELRPGEDRSFRELFTPKITELTGKAIDAQVKSLARLSSAVTHLEQALHDKAELTAVDQEMLDFLRENLPKAADDLERCTLVRSIAGSMLSSWVTVIEVAEKQGAAGIMQGFVDRYKTDAGFMGTLARARAGDARARQEEQAFLAGLPQEFREFMHLQVLVTAVTIIENYTHIEDAHIEAIRRAVDNKRALTPTQTVIVAGLGLEGDWTVAEAKARRDTLVVTWSLIVSAAGDTMFPRAVHE